MRLRKPFSVAKCPQANHFGKHIGNDNKILSLRAGSSFHTLKKYYSVVLGSVVDPTIAGGLLSGGLHAITGI